MRERISKGFPEKRQELVVVPLANALRSPEKGGLSVGAHTQIRTASASLVVVKLLLFCSCCVRDFFFCQINKETLGGWNNWWVGGSNMPR